MVVELPEQVEDLGWNELKREAANYGIYTYKKSKDELQDLLKEELRKSHGHIDNEDQEQELAKDANLMKAIKRECPNCKYNSEFVASENKKKVYKIDVDAKCEKYNKKSECALIKTKSGVK